MSTMLRKCLVLLLLLFVLTSECSRKTKYRPKYSRPHIVLFVIDDLGWNDVSFHGSPQIPTPNIDALAADGTVLTNYYVLPICTPSRSALLSGYYPIHTGMQHNVIYGQQPYGLPLNLTLLPEYLQRRGYATHAIGKWHLGFFKKEYTPTFRGFDSHYGYWLGHGSYYDHTGWEEPAYGLDFRDNLEPVWNQGGRYATEIFTEKAVKLIRGHNASQPMFLYLSHLAVHGGNGYSVLEAPAQYTARFPHIGDIRRRLFAGMVSAVDDSLGEVVRALSEARMLENTLIVVTTDNGGATAGIDNSVGSNWPLRGTKYTLWEGGVKGTALFWYPHMKGRSNVRSQLMHISDWMPTLYRAAGGHVSDLGPLDGLDMWDSLMENSPSPRQEVLLNIDPIWQVAALISDRFKIVSGIYSRSVDSWYGPSGRDNKSMEVLAKLPHLTNTSMVAKTLRKIGRHFQAPPVEWYKKFNVSCTSVPKNPSCPHPEAAPCLFDLVKDPCEYHDLASIYPQVLNDLIQRLVDYNSTSVPPANPPLDPRSDPKNFNFVWSSWL